VKEEQLFDIDTRWSFDLRSSESLGLSVIVVVAVVVAAAAVVVDGSPSGQLSSSGSLGAGSGGSTCPGNYKLFMSVIY
jgi:hypothetical protein